MNDYQPKKGDRVRVVIEGTVTNAAPFVGTFEMDGSHWYGSELNGFTSVERLPDPEPEWQPDDVVLSGGLPAIRNGVQPKPWTGPSGMKYADDQMTRPLTLLVRDGKPVQA